MTVKIDSGACDTVISPKMGRAFKITESEMSRSNAIYSAANGTPIKNFGKRSLQGVDMNFMPITLEAQVAEVSGALGSVYQICKAGNRVCFDESGGVIVNMSSGRVIPIKQNKGPYEMEVWIPAAKDKNQEVQSVRSRQIESQEESREKNEKEEDQSEEEEESLTMDFVRQG